MQRILIIDDEEMPRTTFAAVATRAGLAPLTAATYESFRSQLDDSVDGIVLDLCMPHVDGLEIIRYLAKVGTDAGIVLTSGYDAQILRSAERLASTRGLRIVGTLKKPFKLSAAIDLFRKAVAPRTTPGAHLDLGVTPREVETAILDHQLVLHYQPQVNLRTGRAVGVEALVRWQHPRMGLLSPIDFIPIAESTGLIDGLTRWVIREAFSQGMAWREKNLMLRMAVNCSMKNLRGLTFVNDVEEAAEQTGWSLKDTILEVTETAVASDHAVPLEVLTRLAMHGALLSIDDFGTGYATLDQLDRAPFSELKLDHLFVRRASSDEKTRIIVESSLVMAHRLGLAVVAEGVEDKQLYDWVKGMNCELAQGYYIARPMPADHLFRWMKER